MAITASNIYSNQMVAESATCSTFCSLQKSLDRVRSSSSAQRVDGVKVYDEFMRAHRRHHVHDVARIHVFSCMRNGSRKSGTKYNVMHADNFSDQSREQIRDGNLGRDSQKRASKNSSQGIAEAFRFAHNDAKFVNERARSDIVLLSCGITILNNRAHQDVAVLGMRFLKLKARVREDTEKIDSGLKKKAAHLHHIAMILKDKAQSKLKRAADRHWNDGALEADLRQADMIVRRRAMEDAFMALKFVRNIHDMMVNKQQLEEDVSSMVDDVMGYVTLERNGKSFNLFPGEVSTNQIADLQEAYWSMASALSETDEIDYSDPDDLELLVATLIDLDAMDGKSSASLLAEWSSSPDLSTRKALANALAAAPSMWTLGNAGMGALQRLAEDRNPTVAAAASTAIDELRRRWEVQESDSLTFMMNQNHHNENSDGTAPNEERS